MSQLPKHPRLILAEDDDDARTMLEEIFARDGFDVISTRDGEELVRALESARDREGLPCVVVTDYDLPGYNGLDVTRALRDNGWPVPIIIITGHGEAIGELGIAAGADAVFQKPLNTQDLRTAAWYWAESRQQGTNPN